MSDDMTLPRELSDRLSRMEALQPEYARKGDVAILNATMSRLVDDVGKLTETVSTGFGRLEKYSRKEAGDAAEKVQSFQTQESRRMDEELQKLRAYVDAAKMAAISHSEEFTKDEMETLRAREAPFPWQTLIFSALPPVAIFILAMLFGGSAHDAGQMAVDFGGM